MDETAKFYRVKIPVAVRSAPDIESAKIPGVAAKVAGSIIESSARFTPPGSSVTYCRLAHEYGWVFDSTLDGMTVLEALDEGDSLYCLVFAPKFLLTTYN